MLRQVLRVLLYINLFNECVAITYHLNDAEYERMPPLFALDDYESCLWQPNGVYCLMEFDLHGGPDKDLISLIKDYSEHRVKHYNHSYIQRGVCVQKTCQKFIRNRPLNNEVVLNSVLEECLNDSIRNRYGLEARMKQLNYCDTKDDVTRQNQKDIGDWVVAGMFAAIIIVNILGYGYDVTLKEKTRSKGNQYLLSFSVLQNWQALTYTIPTDPRMARLRGLHGYKTITIMLMIIAHVMWINSMGFTENTHDFEKTYENIGYQLVFNGMMIIQVFLTQSGFLLAYKLLIISEKQPLSWKMFPQLVFMRWWRLTPPYAVVLAFTATWLRHVGSGPLWRLWVADSVVADCRSFWWMHLLYVNNYVSDDKFCAIQTWYLGAEMQVFAISLFLLLIATTRRQGLVLSILLIFGSVIPALHVYFQDLDGIVIMDPEFYRTCLSDTFAVHILGHNYLASYAIGMGAACVLVYLEKKDMKKNKSKIFQLLSLYVFPAMFCLFLSGGQFYADGPRAQMVTRMMWATGHRLVMSGIAAYTILSLVMRFNESTCALFDHPAWVVLSRLSYCVYLVHINFIHVLLGSRAYLTQVSSYNMIIVYLGVVVISFMAALPLYLLVEAPATRLIKVFASR